MDGLEGSLFIYLFLESDRNLQVRLLGISVVGVGCEYTEVKVLMQQLHV